MGQQHHHHSLLLLLLPLLLLAGNCRSTTSADDSHHEQHHHHHHTKLKSLHFTLFQQETLNKTAFLITNGVVTAGAPLSSTTTPFGALFSFEDPMTVTVDPSSRVAGLAEGSSITSSFDGLRTLTWAKITLNYKGHKGTIAVLGGSHNTKAADTPVVGGTGDYLFVQGFVRGTPVNLVPPKLIYKIEFNLYWPPYATQMLKK